MRHLPKFSDDYGSAGDELAAAAILSSELDDLDDAYGDDWVLKTADDLESLKVRRH